MWPVMCITITEVYGKVSKLRGRLRLATTGNSLKCVILVLTFTLRFDDSMCDNIFCLSSSTYFCDLKGNVFVNHFYSFYTPSTILSFLLSFLFLLSLLFLLLSLLFLLLLSLLLHFH